MSTSAWTQAPAVRLEAHANQTGFLLGDPIRVDLVFPTAPAGYTVNTSPYLYLPIPEQIAVQPASGWTRSHRPVAEGESDSTPADAGPVRVPILLNRAITIHQPGRYTVTVTTSRLLSPGSRNGTAGMQSTSNPLAIEVRSRTGEEEAALVRSLIGALTTAEKPRVPPNEATIRAMTPEQLMQYADAMVAGLQQAADDRIDQALRLAFLPGDDAMRARIRLIAAVPDDGSGDPVGLLVEQGLPSSQDLDLQAELLSQIWRDPTHVPTELLVTAVREARELLHGPTIRDTQVSSRVLSDPEFRAKMIAEQDVIRAEQHALLLELVPTLAGRSAANRVATVCFLSLHGMGSDGSAQKAARCPQQ